MDEQVRRIAQGVALGGLVIVFTVVLILLVIRLAEVLGIIALGVIVGITLAPLAERGRRVGIPRIISGLLVYAVLVGALVGFFWVTVPAVIADVPTAEDVSEVTDWYESLADRTPLPNIERLITYIEEFVDDAPLEDVAGQALALITVIFYVLAISVVGLFVTITKDPAYDLALSMVATRHRPATAAFLLDFAARLRRYVLATIVRMLAVGLIVYIGLVIIGIPFALPLAVLAFLFEIIPIVGPWIAFIPAFAVALTEGVFAALAVAILYLVLQQVESYVITPVIYGRGTQMPGLLVLIAIMIGFPLMGVLGALLALPVALFFYTLVTRVIVPWRQQQLLEHAVARREDARARRRLESEVLVESAAGSPEA